MIYLTSTFSVGMCRDIRAGRVVNLAFRQISTAEARRLVAENGRLLPGIVSGVGHPATAAAMAAVLGIELPPVDPAHRVKIDITSGDQLVIFQYVGPRLAEGQLLTQSEIDSHPDWFVWVAGHVEQEADMHEHYQVCDRCHQVTNDLDVGFCLDGMPCRCGGTWRATNKHPAAVELGRRGGRVRSEAKARAARASGKLGGRPPVLPGIIREKLGLTEQEFAGMLGDECHRARWQAALTRLEERVQDRYESEDERLSTWLRRTGLLGRRASLWLQRHGL